MKINACTKTYGGRTVLRFPGLELEPGKLCAVVGANGSGKSTFAKLLSGVVPPDGNVRVLETPVSLRYMPQRSYAFRLTVRRNILLSGGTVEQAERLMGALGLTSLADQRAGGLSGGETARMALARVLMRPCELLILDEPTASMDMESAILAERLVSACRAETNCTVLLITHDLQQARRLADKALFFHSGQLWETGPAARILFTPEKPETKRFLEFYGGENKPSKE
ncbi:MAG: ATP-binding cassette domain-containing protein [Oscillospiraceae bacterium]|nr:ATP-binding cassette domain-containing protein [Oscillospiraceae bacterium]